MADHSSIEWTDATWSPVTGCTKVSEGCRNCYIERTAPFRTEGRKFQCPRCEGSGYVEDSDGNRLAYGKRGQFIPGARCPRCSGSGRAAIGDTTGVRMHEDRLDVPLHWRKPRKVFVCSLADLFHKGVSGDFIARVLAVMALTPHHTYQVLTKRPARMRALLSSPDFREAVIDHVCWYDNPAEVPRVSWPLPNVHVGVSVEDQKTADQRIPILLDTPAAVRWLSCEPLLGRTWLTGLLPSDSEVLSPLGSPRRPTIDWVVAGGESGPGARPMHPDWARSLRDQCASAGVPFLFKQWGEWEPDEWIDADGRRHVGRKPEARDPKSLVMHPAGMTALTPDNPFDPWERGHPNWRTVMRRVGKKRAGRLLDGVQHDGYPDGA